MNVFWVSWFSEFFCIKRESNGIAEMTVNCLHYEKKINFFHTLKPTLPKTSFETIGLFLQLPALTFIHVDFAEAALPSVSLVHWKDYI